MYISWLKNLFSKEDHIDEAVKVPAQEEAKTLEDQRNEFNNFFEKCLGYIPTFEIDEFWRSLGQSAAEVDPDLYIKLIGEIRPIELIYLHFPTDMFAPSYDVRFKMTENLYLQTSLYNPSVYKYIRGVEVGESFRDARNPRIWKKQTVWGADRNAIG